MATESQDQADLINNNNDNPLPSLLPPEQVTVPSYSSQSLLTLLSKAFPDVPIAQPHINLLGQQSSGKTMMILRLLFHFLSSCPGLQDVHSQRLTRIFPTGRDTVTRRPVTISLIRSEIAMQFRMSIKYKGQEIALDAENMKEFDSLLDTIYPTNQMKAFFQEPMTLEIVAQGDQMANLTFTDLPGLYSDHTEQKLQDADESCQYVRDIILEYLHNPNVICFVTEQASIDEKNSSIIQLIT